MDLKSIEEEMKEKEDLIKEYRNRIRTLSESLVQYKKKRASIPPNLPKDKSLSPSFPKQTTIDTIADEFKVSEPSIKRLGTGFTASSSGGSRPDLHKKESNLFAQKRRSHLPSFAKHCLYEWKDINVHVGNGENEKQILHEMNGAISSGELMAIMGGSGAGKSTLLNILSGRTNLATQRVTGAFSINNKVFPSSQQSIVKALCSFIPQSDVLCSTQTVEEALMFYAQLRLCNKTRKQQIKRIEYLIDALHLEVCRENMIGDMDENSSKKGISGGERRRASIAAEIINDVDIIFLDEPTSGLDAYTAAETIKTLKEFCTVSNKIIIATIHQPSIETFYLFDKLILLSRGKCCYNGAVKDIDVFFKSVLRPKTNPADVILFAIQKDPDGYAKKWAKSALNPLSIPQELRGPTILDNEPFTMDDVKRSNNNLENAPRRIQLTLLLKRELQALYRDKKVSLIRLVQVLFFAVTSGVLYFDVKPAYGARAQAFFLLSIIPLLFGMISSLVVFPKQKALFQREYNSNTYSTLMFASSFIIIEIPREVIHMAIFNAIALGMTGLDGPWWKYWVNLFLCSFAGGSFGLFFGVVSKSTTEASQMVPASLIPLLMFSGGLVKINTLPSVLQWIALVDPLYYLFRAFMIIEFTGVTYPRTLSEEDKYLCNEYNNSTAEEKTEYRQTFLNATAENSTVGVYNCSFIGYNETGTGGVDQNPSSPSQPNTPNTGGSFPDFTTTLVLSNGSIPNGITYDNKTYTTTQGVYSNFTTTHEYHEKIEMYCMEEIPSSYFFEAENLSPSDLYPYWIYIVVICLIVRFFSIFLLWVMNNNGFTWLCSLPRRMMNCCTSKDGGKRTVEKQMSLIVDAQNGDEAKVSETVTVGADGGVEFGIMNEDMTKLGIGKLGPLMAIKSQESTDYDENGANNPTTPGSTDELVSDVVDRTISTAL